jgi:hypothetical protein
MDRLSLETDVQYRSRIINLPTGKLSEADKALLAAKITALAPQGYSIFLFHNELSSVTISLIFDWNFLFSY